MVLGLSVTAFQQFNCSSPTMRIMEVGICNAVSSTGFISIGLGMFGITASCCHKGRCALLSYAVLAQLFGAACGVGCAYFLAVVSTNTTLIDYACIQEQRSSTVSSHVAFAGGTTSQLSFVAAEAQAVYNSMSAALQACRVHTPAALRLEGCEEAQSSVAASNDSDTAALAGNIFMQGRWNDYQDMFRWAEDQYLCGGFCQGGMPVFALPAGSVTQDNKLSNRSACFAPLVQEARWRASLACAALGACSILVVAPVLCACWLACAPPPKVRAGYVHRPEELEWNPVSQRDEDEEDMLEGAEMRPLMAAE